MGRASRGKAAGRVAIGKTAIQVHPGEARAVMAELEALDSPRDLAYQAAHQAMLTKTRYRLLEERAVRLGREGGVSWDVLGGWLTVPGETLRKRYGS